VVEGDTVSGAFDSMIAKLVVTGATRRQAVERARRALAELEVEGIPTVVPFHRAVLEAPEFVPANDDEPFTIHTRWIETGFADRLAQLAPANLPVPDEDENEPTTERVVVEVGGKRLEVVIPAGLGMVGSRARSANAARRPARRQPVKAGPSANGTSLTSPMQGTIVKVAVEDGEQVAAGDLVVVLEAMKMEQPLVAHRAGTVKSLTASVGAGVSSGTVICEIVD
jgi:acetyl-CoA/propionyl-CoA carboxylase biotin carboxyl carrier protein